MRAVLLVAMLPSGHDGDCRTAEGWATGGSAGGVSSFSGEKI